jgi:uncharacterized protein
VGRGKGKKGSVIGKDDQGQGKGNKAGEGHQDGVVISIDMEEVIKFLQNELMLPDLKPKPSEVFDEVKIKYNNIALQGPESLRHNPRTMLQALKRMCASGEINNLHEIPGFADPVRVITPINSDRRYRQFREIRQPSSNAVIFFARDGSGSMDEYKCDIVSDMCWWIDVWIRRFYKRVERCYVWHDVEAEEVDENKFYNYRYGGGTACSSALKLIDQQLQNRFPPAKWNIYVFYFTDGENMDQDNEVFNKVLKEKLGPDIVNFVGVTQILAWNYGNTLKAVVDEAKHPNVRTTSIGPDDKPDMSNKAALGFYGGQRLTDEERDGQIKRAIMDLLGAESPKQPS